MVIVSCSPATHSGQKRSDRKRDRDERGEHRDVDRQQRRFRAEL